jgi:DNA polymerase III subunit delta'
MPTDARPADLPWLAPQMAALREAQRSERLPHALLLQEAPGSGGLWLAQWFAQLVFCREPAAPCGECSECRRVLRNEHPDLRVISYFEDPKTGKVTAQIRVDQIRELVEELSLTSHGSRGTVVVIHPADAMNANALNSLLKTLEEPRGGVFIVLVSAASSRLPATVRSRCQRMAIRVPSRQQTLAWLEGQRASPDWSAVLDVTGSAPLDALAADPAATRELRDDVWTSLREALRGALDVPGTADRWGRLELPGLLVCIENYLTSQVLSRYALTGQNAEMRGATHLPGTDLDINIAAVFGVLDGVRELQLMASTPINKALALESLLWRLTGGQGDRAGTASNAG